MGMRKIKIKMAKRWIKKNRFALIVAVLLISSIFYFSDKTKESYETRNIVVREPAVAGSFYPGSNENLAGMIDSLLEQAELKDVSDIKGLVAPHAGYIFSGLTAAHGFKQLVGSDYETVILISPSHHVFVDGFTIANVTHYKTPFGLVELSPKVDDLRQEFLYSYTPTPKEHSLEVMLPFLQRVLGDFKIVPVVTGNVNPRDLASLLKKYVDGDTLIVASTDLSHYHPYAEANALDKVCTDSISSLNFEGMVSGCEACGKVPTLTLMYIANDLGWKSTLLDYRNSGDTAGDKGKVVGYTSIAFHEIHLTEGDKEFLVHLARDTLNSYLKDGKKPDIDEAELSDSLKKVQGCFVTLDSGGHLRGCIGHIIPQEELYKCVIDNAISAATKDRRFNPVDYDESKGLGVEVSVLTVPEKLSYDSPDDLLNKLRPMVDGVVVKSGWRQSTYLPQVWDAFPDKESFLSQLCLKGGSNGDCWKKENTEIYTYQAEVFHENEFKE